MNFNYYRELIDNPKTTILSKIGTDIKEGINIFHKYDTTDPIYKKFSEFIRILNENYDTATNTEIYNNFIKKYNDAGLS